MSLSPDASFHSGSRPCPQCGAPSIVGDNFCDKCGTPLGLDPDVRASDSGTPPNRTRSAILIAVVLVAVVAIGGYAVLVSSGGSADQAGLLEAAEEYYGDNFSAMSDDRAAEIYASLSERCQKRYGTLTQFQESLRKLDDQFHPRWDMVEITEVTTSLTGSNRGTSQATIDTSRVPTDGPTLHAGGPLNWIYEDRDWRLDACTQAGDNE